MGQVFPPKGSDPADACSPSGVTRAPQDTRPIGLKNCDFKVILGASYRRVRPHVAAVLAGSQCGFVPGRNFLTNIFTVDAAGRPWHRAASPYLFQ